jgi:preprotein translocase subunit SecA
MLGFIKKVFGTKSERDVKRLLPFVEATNQEFGLLKNISDDQLRGKTEELKGVIRQRLATIDQELKSLHDKIADQPELTINQKEEIFEKIDELESQRNTELEKVLWDILPKAFAVIKETARRYKENGSLVVSAGTHDQTIAAKKANVKVSDGKATWHNKWIAAGNEVTWDMMHYDVQLIGGMVLHEFKIFYI